MPLRNDLLTPISPENPSGERFRYSPLYEKIREARREDDPYNQGDLQYTRKLADWPLTIKLAGEALATRSKDLEIAAWLTEAMLKREGISGLHECLGMIRGLLEDFWDTLYPELEDGDAETRAARLQWVADQLAIPVKAAPITAGKLSWLQYRESREVGTEAEAESYDKQQARLARIAEGKMPAEAFDKDFEATPKKFYADLEKEYDGTLESLAQLSRVCDEKFGDISPSFRPLQLALEEVRQTVHILLTQKRKKEPDADAPPAEEEESAPQAPAAAAYAAPAAAAYAAPAASAAAPAPAPAPARPAGPLAPVPQNREDAVARVVAAARFLRQESPFGPAPYLMLRGLRWGELRGGGTEIDPSLLVAPPMEIPQALKRLAGEGKWTEVLETAETAMGMECGRGWLDLQRYVGRACVELGGSYDLIRTGVVSDLRALLGDFPKLPEMTMTDDRPTANAETQAWIREVAPPPAEPEPVYQAPPPAQEAYQPGLPAAPDVFELATQLARKGRAQEAIEMLMRELAQEPSGRGRFQRRIQVAQLCLSSGNEAVAVPILQEAAAEIDRRRLEEWEEREVVAHPLAMLYRCLGKSDGAAQERQKLYAAICRLDPLEAMKIGK